LEIYDIIMSLKPFMEGDLLNYKKFVQQFFWYYLNMNKYI
jgi:hypothetical protein